MGKLSAGPAALSGSLGCDPCLDDQRGCSAELLLFGLVCSGFRPRQVAVAPW